MPEGKEPSEEKIDTRKTMRVFSWASFLNDLGADMIYPIWPFFVTVFLGANMAVLGFIDGLSDAVVSLSQAASGYLSDRIRKRKLFIWLGYLFGGISRVGYAVSSVWQHLIPFRILDRAGKIRDAPRDAMLADISKRANRGENFGILKAMDKLGGLFGVVFTVLFFSFLGYKNIFLIAAIPSFIGLALILFFIKEKKSENPEERKWLSFKEIGKDFRLFLFLSSFFALGSFSYSFLLVFASRLGFKISFVPVLYLIFTSVAFLFSLPSGRMADKIGRKPMLMVAYILWGLVCWCFIFLRMYPWAIILSFVLYGIHKGILDPVQRTFVSELAPEKYRASALGLFQMVIGMCALPSSLIAGIVWDKFGFLAPFCISLALTIPSILLLTYVKEA
ncbi:MAG: MFS transporter [Candidatus Woesearchaeota archaeon]|nr:MFS transporter [Candidatus Woesearchaeota archaeon]